MYESEENILNRYIKLLEDPKCSMEIKQKAIKSVTGYFETINKSKKSIKLFKQFYNIFKEDQEIIRLYVRLLWNNQNGTEACAVLADYYKGRKKSKPESLALFFIWVEYQGKLILNRRREDIKKANDNRELIDSIMLEHKPLCFGQPTVPFP